MQLSLVTWNMNHWRRTPEERRAAWGYLRDELNPDIALLQEVGRPDAEVRAVYSDFRDPNRPWGTAVVAFNSALALAPVVRRPITPYLAPFEVEDSQPGTSAAGVVTTPGGRELVVVSAYGAMEKSGNGLKYATTTMHRVISDFTSVLDARRERRPVVFGGDFNCSTQFGPSARADHEVLFGRLRAHGLTDCFAATSATRQPMVDCFCGHRGSCDHQRTLRHNNKPGSRPWQVDYLFSHHLVPTNMQLDVVDHAESWALSDHAPVKMTFELA